MMCFSQHFKGSFFPQMYTFPCIKMYNHESFLLFFAIFSALSLHSTLTGPLVLRNEWFQSLVFLLAIVRICKKLFSDDRYTVLRILEYCLSVCLTQWADDSTFRWSHEGRVERCIFCRQSPDRVWITRQNHQAVEHTGSVQVHYSGLEECW